MFAFDSVDVTIEETGVTVEAEENESVGERLEEWLDLSFKRLVWLGIVVHDESLECQLVRRPCKGNTYHSIDWHSLDESVIEDTPEITSFSFTELTEVVNEWCIEQAKLLAHALKVIVHVGQTVLPEFSDEEPSWAKLLVHKSDEFAEEILAKMLDSIETDTFERDFSCKPFSPV